MTMPTPKDAVPFDPPVFCSGIERDCKHGQLARSCHICELERELAAAQERAQAAEARAEAAEKDAGRYRWLRVQPHADIAACWYMPVLPQDYPVDTPEQRDAAIDAVIAEGKKP